ncbi:hypothetical protein EB796_012348 [Bugula neritina]|uniref:Uncharacterized protein n=1 Tax=Bugula neritina TaxID=10212 RepID=A0A7J7JTV1_BUGNE|nr:hypothetical protein EB796_012348 [Bugula neritina]
MLHDAAANGNKNFLLANSREAQILNGRNVGQCDSDPCLQAPCTHGICTMVDSFSYKCDCFGSYTGLNCDSKSKKIRDLLRGDDSRPYNEVVWSGGITSANGKEGKVFELPRFTGRSYIQYKLTQEVDYNLTLDIVFRTDQADGVLFFGCQSSNSLVSGDYILLSIEDRVPVVRLDLGSGTNTLRLQEKVVMKDWNMISLRRSGKQISLALNMEPAMNITYSGEMMYLNVDSYVTLGAIPHTLEHTKGFLHSPGLRGVIQRVSINGDDILDFFHSTHGQYRVKKYHGPPCHPNPCGRGTICIPLLNTYKCDLI